MSAPGRMIPATEEDTLFLRKIMNRMPFAGGIFAPHFRAVEAEEIPAVNAKGGRDTDGWTAVYEAIVQPDWINGGGGLHGAAAAWIVDMTTGTTFRRLFTNDWNIAGPSINIDMTYYHPAPPGTRIRVECTIDRMGGLLATARCLIINAENGKRIASGMHTTIKPSKGGWGRGDKAPAQAKL
ncbi:hypothetical protein Q8F55_003266 [Vanrija albida]|uniref:Thioesterase domain-containing protein n=1 Tax=Vanrija albida TaxID=181172 RepID=A0ABR3QC07_9TREE